jgi:predicted metal-dependent hydrolase
LAEPRPARQPYLVRRSSRARRSRLTFNDSGQLVVVLPLRAADDEAAQLLARHATWVERQRARLEQRRIRLATRPSLAAGRPLSVAGITKVYFARDETERAALERALRRQARLMIGERVQLLAPQVGVAVGRIQVRDQRSRWGSASRNGTLSFSWRLILCPPPVFDYVVVHELAHLHVAGHGRRFWQLVERHFGDHRAARRWLREHQAEIRQALD